MKTMLKRVLMLALVCAALFAVSFHPVYAQEATPDPTSAPVVVPDTVVTTDTGDVVVEPDTSPLAPLLAMAGAVFGLMELVKNVLLKRLYDRWTLDEQAIAALNWMVASMFAILLVFGAQTPIDIFTLAHYPNPFGDVFGRLVTALLIGGGNAILHAGYDFLRMANPVVGALAAVVPREPVESAESASRSLPHR